jgi:hypothetical protein
MSGELRAGVARVDITPPVGISMVGYYIREGVSTGVERPLTATALVLESDNTRLVFVSCDIAFIQDPAATEIRGRIAKALNTGPASVLLNYSHTHCGPTLPGFLWQDEEQVQIQRTYLSRLSDLLVQAAVEAVQALRPARIGAGSGSANIGINRREIDEEGKAFVGENPSGPVDHEVVVVRVDEPDGRPIAVLYNHGCHTVTMGAKCLRLSPDYVGPARELIERTTGALSLFLQGAAGNINPSTGIGSKEDDSENMIRLGHILGGEVIKTLASIRTHEYRSPRMFLSSLARVSLYPYLPRPEAPTPIAVRAAGMNLPMLPLPSLEEARDIRRARHAAFDEGRRNGRSPGVLTVLRHFADWGDKLVATLQSGTTSPGIPFEVTALQLGDIGLLAMPCEPLVELGQAVKRASPFPTTMFLGYTNGCIGYLPPASAYPAGGWSPWETYAIPDMLFQSYQLPMALDPQCAQMVIDRSIALLNGLKAQNESPQ